MAGKFARTKLYGTALGLVVSACASSASPSQALLEAVLAGNRSEADRLITAGADPRVDPAGNCLLFAAVHAGRPDMAELLVKRGTDLECRKEEGDTALQRALDTDKPVVASKLTLLGANVNAKPGRNSTYPPLQVALFNHVRKRPGFDLELIHLLLKKGADPNTKAERGYTALGLAISRGSPELIDILLNAGADPNLVDGEGATAMSPLEAAVSVGRSKEIVQRLLLAGADPRREVTKGSLLEVAKRRHPELVPLLVQHGATGKLN